MTLAALHSGHGRWISAVKILTRFGPDWFGLDWFGLDWFSLDRFGDGRRRTNLFTPVSHGLPAGRHETKQDKWRKNTRLPDPLISSHFLT